MGERLSEEELLVNYALTLDVTGTAAATLRPARNGEGKVPLRRQQLFAQQPCGDDKKSNEDKTRIESGMLLFTMKGIFVVDKRVWLLLLLLLGVGISAVLLLFVAKAVGLVDETNMD